MITAAGVLAAITAFLELATLEFKAAPLADQQRLGAIHAHVLEGLADLLMRVHLDVEAGVDKLKGVVAGAKVGP